MNENEKKGFEPVPVKDLVHRFEVFADAYSVVRDVAITKTLPQDWADFGGKPWLTAKGAERVRLALGITVKDWTWERHDFTDEKGSYFMIVSEGTVGLKSVDVWSSALGTCTSRKPLYFKERDRERHISEIDPGNIIKDSYSNMIENGISRFMGLRGLEWEDLEEYGIEKGKGAKVKFKKKKKEGKTEAKTPPKTDTELATDQQRQYLAKMASKKVIDTDEAKILETLPAEMPRHMLNTLLKWVAEKEVEISLDDWMAVMSSRFPSEMKP